MKRILVLLAVLILISLCILLILRAPVGTNLPIRQGGRTPSPSATSGTITTIASGLDTPWAVAFLPTKEMLVTERPGRVRLVSAAGELIDTPVATLSEVTEIGEGGLLGIAVDPAFGTNHRVYLYYTYAASPAGTRNRVVSMRYENGKLADQKVLLDTIPGAANHNGGRIRFGPDGYLYIGTGDAQEPSAAQNTKSLAGKILRIRSDGSIPSDNPFNNPVYSFGHRNVQGLAWDSSGQLWATEHGRSGAASGYDEVNRIVKGKNYGWPDIEGSETRSGMVSPVAHSGATTTWAPSGIAFADGSLFFAGLKGAGIYETKLGNTTLSQVTKHIANVYGRLREVILGPDEYLYLTTSNRDGRGTALETDDRILRVSPQSLQAL